MQEEYTRVKEAVEALAEMEYPKVWVGKEGITPEEAMAEGQFKLSLAMEALEDGTPEEAEEVWAELGTESDEPPVETVTPISVNWVDALTVYKKGLHRYIDPDDEAELSSATRVIGHAKHGRVPVVYAWGVDFKDMEDLDHENGDIEVAKAFTHDGRVLVPTVPKYNYVDVEDLAPEDMDDDLLDYLECYASKGSYVMVNSFVMEENAATLEAVDSRLEEG